MWKTYNYLKSRYGYLVFEPAEKQAKPKKCISPDIFPIWILWLQGFENAPDIVKLCLSSIKTGLKNGETIILLDATNIWEYVDLPDYIIAKWEKGVIDNTKLSNCIRLRLLNTYGGMWIDATVLYTGNGIPDLIKKSSLTLLQLGVDNYEPRAFGTWLMASKPNNFYLLLKYIH